VNQLLGSVYTKLTGRALTGFLDTANNADIFLDQGNLPGPILKVASFETTNVITINEQDSISKGEGLTVKIDANAGTFSGSFLHPVAAKRLNIQGVLFQKQEMAVGGFNGLSLPGVQLQTGRVSIEPK
jgi:hypothetical protein